MHEDILNFQVRLYSPNGKDSPVEDYLDDLADTNKQAWVKCVDQILNLPQLIFIRHKSIKPFQVKSESLFELKVRHQNNTFRFYNLFWFFYVQRSYS